MPLLSFLIGPAVGGVIGGLTNKVAIRMLFRPYEAKYVGRIHIPLTPGIIPKEKSRIAAAIGATVSQNLLNSQILSATLLSDDMCGKVGEAIDALQARMMADDETLEEFLLQYVAPDELQRISSRIQGDITSAVYARLTDEAIGRNVASLAIGQVMNRLSESFLGGLKAGILELMRDSVEARLADIINDILHDNARQMLSDMVADEAHSLLSTPICQLCRGREEFFIQLRSVALKAYRLLVENSLPRMLDTLNIQGIIETRINAMDMAETETLIVEIMDKELKALVWFGVLLGFLLGFITNII